MAKDQFYQLFLNDLFNIYSSENQIIDAIPKWISTSSSEELSEALQEQWEDTRNQIARLDRIFEMLKENPKEKLCQPVEALILQVQEIIDSFGPSPVADAGLINILQCIEHYCIAMYGTMRTFAKQLDLEEVADLLQESLNEEANANRILTELAVGGVLATGINKKASKS